MSRELDQVVTRMGAERRTLERNVAAINADVRQVRLQPIGSAYEGLDRAVRDLARAAGKNARLLLRDRGAEVDRSVIESLKDPLLHLVRNAVDHGIETPEERRAASKPEQGMVGIAAAVHGDQIEIVVADDGRGLDVAAVMARAEKLGLTVGSDAEAADVIFVPGFSTAPLVTSISGRGVGLDVVRSNVERQRGTIRVDWTPGGGTRFEIRLPLTLTTLRALHVRAGMATFLIDSAQVRGLVRIGRADVERMEGRDTIAFDGENVPVVLLADALGLEGGDSEAQTERVPAVVLGSPGRLVALVVDELAADGEVTVKPLSRRLSGHPLVNAATILPDGSVGPIVRPAALVAAALGLGAPRTLTEVLPAAEHGPAKRLLVVDDSVTIRTHEAAILEAAGYEVAVAPDGVAGWQSIQERPPDLVVTDVEMPRMDGFTLVETIRGAKRFADLPVILVTALETDEHKRRGMDVGANAYLPKSSFDQRLLLQTIEQLLSGGQMIRVVIAEDSRTVRQLIESILDDDPKIEVVGRASNGIEAIRLAKELKPDVITMDVNMPLMGGLDATREIMIEAPTRIIIISGSIDVHEIEISMNALRMGAISVVRKPLAPGSDEFTAEARKLVATVKNLAEVKVVRRRREPARRLPPDVASAASQAQIDVVALGTSTGGPATLAELLGALPTDFALPILVVQHIAHGFVHGMASWLNGISPIRVKVAEQGEPLAPRTVYLAEDDRHLEVKTRRRIGLSQGPLVGGFRPSISHLFDSVRDVFGSAAAGVLLTGMGRDGAEGLLRLRLAGAVTVSQTPESCIVYGMPREAELLGAAEHVLEPRAIATLLVSLAAGKRGEHER